MVSYHPDALFTKRRHTEIEGLTCQAREVIVLAMRGFKGKVIAEMVGIHPGTVTKILSSPAAQARLRELRLKRDEALAIKDVDSMIESNAVKAATLFQDIMDGKVKSSDDVKLQVDVGKHQLASVGKGPIQRSKNQVFHGVLSEDLLTQAMEAATNVIDVENLYEESETNEDGVTEIDNIGSILTARERVRDDSDA